MARASRNTGASAVDGRAASSIARAAGTGADTEDAGGTPRERYRAQVRAEIKKRAWQQIAAAGTSALSLNAIAKEMGVSGPALYRYYTGRDALITELVTDAYRSLADTCHAAAAKARTETEADPGAALAALARALRGWALDDPHRYFLVYGTPVPGYHAPDDVTAIAAEIMADLLDAATPLAPDTPAEVQPQATAAVTPPPPPPANTAALHTHLLEHRAWAAGHPAGPATLRRALTFWTRLHGVLSLELAGHFTGMDLDPALLYAAELDTLTTH